LSGAAPFQPLRFRSLALNFYHHKARIIYFLLVAHVSSSFTFAGVVACGFSMHRYITPFYFSRKKASVAFPLLLLALPVKSYTRARSSVHARARKRCASLVGKARI